MSCCIKYQKLFLVFLFFYGSYGFADTLTLYFYPSPTPLDWSTPQSLTQITVDNSISGADHPIGHVSVEVKCEDDPQNKHHILTGMSSSGEGESLKLLIKKKVGLGILFYNLKGRLVPRQEILEELPHLYQNGEISMLTHKISPKTCQRLVRYYDEYKDRGYQDHYGLPNRPRYGEGGGCSAFGTSFLELSGLLKNEYHANWSQLRLVPKKYVGGELTDKKVSLWKLLLPSRPTRWATPKEEHFPIFFWDPDLMHEWATKKWTTEDYKPTGSYKLNKRGNAMELIIDSTHVPTPTDPIWL